MVELENLSQWQGREGVDSGGDTIGTPEETDVDTETGQPAFGAVRVEMVGRRRWAFAPLRDATAGQGHLRVPVAKKRVDDTPAIAPTSELPRDQKQHIVTYDDLPSSRPVGGSGRRLARR
jgi:hypothetical protein